MYKMLSKYVFYVILSILFWNCSSNNPYQAEPIKINVEIPIDLNDGLDIDSPVYHNINYQDLLTAFEQAEEMPFLYSVLIAKDNKLVAERYFHSASITNAKYVASVTKSFVSILIAIAIQENFLTSLDQKMLDFFPEYDSTNIDHRKFGITLRHLITMTAGYQYDSVDEIWNAWVTSPNWVKHAIELPLVREPGESWAYSSASSHILSSILTRATGHTSLYFAQKYLLDSLQIELNQWGRDPQGIYLGGWDMHLTSRDLIKFGMFCLDDGILNEKRYVPENWFSDSWTNSTATSWNWGTFENSRYGYMWWIADVNNKDVFYAQGHAGQNIVIVPSENLVIITTCDADNSFAESWPQSLEIAEFISEYIFTTLENN